MISQVLLSSLCTEVMNMRGNDGLYGSAWRGGAVVSRVGLSCDVCRVVGDWDGRQTHPGRTAVTTPWTTPGWALALWGSHDAASAAPRAHPSYSKGRVSGGRTVSVT